MVTLGVCNFSIRLREEVPETIVCPMEHTQSSDPEETLSFIDEPKGTPMISGYSDLIEPLINIT